MCGYQSRRPHDQVSWGCIQGQPICRSAQTRTLLRTARKYSHLTGMSCSFEHRYHPLWSCRHRPREAPRKEAPGRNCHRHRHPVCTVAMRPRAVEATVRVVAVHHCKCRCSMSGEHRGHSLCDNIHHSAAHLPCKDGPRELHIHALPRRTSLHYHQMIL